MRSETGFFHLNLANEWPKFDLLDPNVTLALDGALTLARTTGVGFATRGMFRGGPFSAMDGPTPWYQVQAYADSLPDGSHVQLFTLTTDEDDIGAFDAAVDDPFPKTAGWHAAPRDGLDLVIPNPPACFLWIGGVLRGDGQTSPRIRQIRVDYGRDTYLSLLPAIYGKDASRRDFLHRFLSLHESVLGG